MLRGLSAAVGHTHDFEPANDHHETGEKPFDVKAERTIGGIGFYRKVVKQCATDGCGETTDEWELVDTMILFPPGDGVENIRHHSDDADLAEAWDSMMDAISERV